jgi:hypothetical protein
MTEQTPYRLQRESREHKFIRLISDVLGVSLLAFNWLATQWAAANLFYAGFLNGRILGHIYQPLSWLWWQSRWPRNALRVGNRVVYFAPLWRACEHLVLYPLLILGAIAAVCGLFVLRVHAPADLHGSASWADAAEIKKAGLL